MKRSGLWYSLALAIALKFYYSNYYNFYYFILKVFFRYLGLQMKDGGRMTFFPYLMSSVLLIMAMYSQRARCVISDQEATCQCAAVIGIVQFTCS